MASVLRHSGVARLIDRQVTQLHGADASRFIQAVLTNDAKHLTHRGSAIYGGFLSSKGRIVGDCHVLQLADDTFLLDYDDKLKEALFKHWKRYKLRMNVEIKDVTDAFDVYATISALVDDMDAALVPKIRMLDQLQTLNSENNAMIFADPRGKSFGTRAIVPAGSSLNLPAGHEMMDASAFSDHQIALGVAEGKEMVEEIPLECNLDLMQGVSFQKGCYVGQELTARTQFKGNVRKRLVPVALIPSDQHDVVKALSQLNFKSFDAPSNALLRAYLADSKGWHPANSPKVGCKIIAPGETKAVGTLVKVGKDVRCAVSMMRLAKLHPPVSEVSGIVPSIDFQTEDAAGYDYSAVQFFASNEIDA
ncbi:transferase caf17 mitochondrial-like [Plasmopara halstedii]|uniref:Transferase caf17 mitochondrial-like n=1 Tax=Plasmopara halstedii TaxID=4781 RepID=A0A0P1AM77_PLAHL|nr:transferase caf17 mitochondrial-like [Plasmopara halstedii]CEG42015.1 transferase caf17 mitochondrial-like [Plasmopara halstedii]|eukprot:XP_024578384.1 transferase caf17 mitochondrial-like [Plasmopara halstedii]